MIKFIKLVLQLATIYAIMIMVVEESHTDTTTINAILNETSYCWVEVMRVAQSNPHLPTITKDREFEVIFTNYYPHDSTNSSDKTGSGLTTRDFEVNELGWYTYNGKVVLATATYEGLKSNYGVLAKYNEELKGITYYHYGDEIQFTFEGIEYTGVCLDTCGSCMTIQPSDNGLQRFDIFIKNGQYAFGKMKGRLNMTTREQRLQWEKCHNEKCAEKWLKEEVEE